MHTSESPPHLTTSTTPLLRLRLILCRLVPFAAVFCFLAWCFVFVRPTHSWDDSEPEILNLAWRLALNKPLYGNLDTPPYIHAAYTPLYPGVVALLLRFTGLNYLPAKLVTFLSVLAIGWAMTRLSRLWSGQGTAGLWAWCFCLLVPAFLYNAVRAHAQMLAVALSIWSFVFFLRGRFLDIVLWSPVLSILALYTKPVQLAAPLVVGLCLLLRNRRWFLSWAAVIVTAGLLPLVWLQNLTGGLFLHHVVELNNLSYHVTSIPGRFLEHAAVFLPFLGLALVLLWPRLRRKEWEPVDIYLLISFLLTIISFGRIGAHTQYVVELCVVTLLFLLRATGLPSIPGRHLLMTVQLAAVLLYTPLFIAVQKGPFGLASHRAAEKIYPLLQQVPGPILSEQASFALFSGREPFIQLFDFADFARRGAWDEGKLIRELEQRNFAWVITEFPVEQPIRREKDLQRFNPAVVHAIRSHYRRFDFVHPYYLYRPQPQPLLPVPGAVASLSPVIPCATPSPSDWHRGTPVRRLPAAPKPPT